MMTKNLEFLQTPFNLRLYGRPIKGVGIDRDGLDRRIRAPSDVRALKEAVSSLHNLASQAKLDEPVPLKGLREAVAPVYKVDRSTADLARVYAYVQGTSRVVLPRPIALLVDGDGEDAWGWDELYPTKDKAYKCWEVDPDEVTLRFDFAPGHLRGPAAARRAIRPAGAGRDRAGGRGLDPRRRQPALPDPAGARPLRGPGRDREEPAANGGTFRARDQS